MAIQARLARLEKIEKVNRINKEAAGRETVIERFTAEMQCGNVLTRSGEIITQEEWLNRHPDVKEVLSEFDE